MKKKFLSLVMALSVVTLSTFPSSNVNAKPYANDAKEKAIERLTQLSKGNLKLYVDDATGKLFLSGKLSENKVPGAADAVQFLEDNKALLNLKDAAKSFKDVKVEKDELGFTHVKLNQLINGVPVQGKEVIVHYDKDGAVIAVNGDVENSITSVTALGSKALTSDEAIQIAEAQFEFDSLIEAPKVEDLVIIKDNAAYEVYKVNVRFSEPTIGNYSVYVEKTSGNILDKQDNIKYAGAVTGTGTLVNGQSKSLNLYYTGTTYQLKDTTKAMTGTISTYTANQGTTQPGTLITSSTTTMSDKAGNSAHYYAGVVYDFYKNLFSRNSIDNAGMSITSTVHYDYRYNNAFWDGSQMVYGDGDGSTFTYLSGDLDVVGHEMTHGVTERTANLVYANQPGALNESMSDVLGVLIETYDKYNVKGGGTWTFNSADWVVGDDVYTPGTAGDALRSLANPALYGQPANMSSYQNLPNTEAGDWGGVHTNSGIPNKAAYLVAQSIGCDKTARIYYRALTTYFTSSTDFTGARSGLIQAATDLYGASSAEVTAVQNGFSSVGIGSSGGSGDTYESNNTISTAYAISFGTTYNSYIYSSTDVDYYKVSPTSSGTISVTLSNLPGDYDLYLVNSAGTILARSENAGTTSETLSYSASAGTYYIKVNGYNGVYSTSTAYALKATFSGSGSLDAYEPNDSTTAAYAITSGTTYKALIGSTTDADYFKITKSASGTISISLTTLPGDYDLYLYNSAGTQVAYSYNSGTTSESINYSAAAGTYYVKVVGYNGAYSTTSQYSLLATF